MPFPLPGIHPEPSDRPVVGRRHGRGRRPRSSPGTREACTWPRGPASQQQRSGKARRPPVNTGEPELSGLCSAERRVLEIQAKLHRWAGDDPHRRFDDLFNLAADPAFLLVAWDRVRGNKGARTAGVDGETAHYIEAVRGVEGFLAELRADLKARTFQPLPVRQRAIPKAGGKVRYLGIARFRRSGSCPPVIRQRTRAKRSRGPAATSEGQRLSKPATAGRPRTIFTPYGVPPATDDWWLIPGHAARLSSRRARWLVRLRSSGVPVQ